MRIRATRRSRLIGPGALVALLLTADAYAQTPIAGAPAEPPWIGLTFDAGLLRDLPTSDDLFAVIETIQPSIVSDRFSAGGLYVGQPARVGGFLGSWTQTLFRIGDVNLTDPSGSGSPLLIPDLVFWQRVDVATGLMPADVSTPGLAITLEPRRPTTDWMRTVHASLSHLALASGAPASATAPAIARLDGWDRFAVLTTGPLITNRLGVALGASWTRGSQFSRRDTTAEGASVGSAFAHLVFTPTDRDEIRLVGLLQRSEYPLQHRAAFNRPTAASTDAAGHGQAVWERRAVDATPWRVFASYSGRHRTHDLAQPAAGAIERLADGPVPDLGALSAGETYQWSLGARVAPSGRRAGRPHTAQMGLEAGGGRVEASSMFAGTIGELVDGHPARVWRFSSPGVDSLRHQIGVNVYFSDRIDLTSRIAVDAGIRFDSVSGSAQYAAVGVRWRTWLPRAAIRWAVTDRWRTSVFGGYSRSAYRLALDLLAVGDPAAPTADVFRWNASPSASPALNALGPLVFRAGPGTRGDTGFSRIDPDLKRPVSDEFVVGLEAWPNRDLRLRLVGTARREDRLFGLVNVGAPRVAYATFTVQDPGADVLQAGDDRVVTVYNRLPASFGQDRYVLTSPGQDAATVKGIELSASINRERFVLFAGATASIALAPAASPGFGPLENDQSRLGELFVDPNAETFARGRPFTDRAYTIKLAGVYRFPADIRLGVVARYQDGQPFARVLVFPALNQGAVAVRAFANGDSRFTFTGTLDLRLQKGFAFGKRRVDALLDAYNLLNLAYAVEERIAAAPDVRTVTAVQPTRAFHVGVRVGF